MIIGLLVVLLVALWFFTRIRNKELFQSGITLKNQVCAAEMPERTYNPAPIPADTPIPNMRIDITPYIRGDPAWKIDLNTIVNYYAPNVGSVKSEDQTALYNERLVPLLTYRNITEYLFKSYNMTCWRDHTRVCLYLMNCNSMLFPFMTKAASITSLTDEAARRNNFKELLKEPKYAGLNQEFPFGEGVINSSATYHLQRGMDTPAGSHDDCIVGSDWTQSVSLSLVAREVHQGNFEACHVFMRLIANTLLMRVNISELTEPQWHRDIDDLFIWFDKTMQYMGTRYRDNNIHLIKIVPLMLAYLGRCRNLSMFVPNLETFFDTVFAIKPGFIWSETNRDVAVINYHLYFLSMMWIVFIIFQATGTPFPFDKYKNLLKPIVDNGVAEVYMNNKIKEKGWTEIQFHDVMTIALQQRGIQLVSGSLTGLTSAPTGSAAALSCLYKPPPPCGAPVPVANTDLCNCTMKKITLDFILNAMDTITPPVPTTTTTAYFTVRQMKILLFYTCLGDFAKNDTCPPINIDYRVNPRMLDFYKYFYEGGPLPSAFTTGFHMSVADFTGALKKWVETEKK